MAKKKVETLETGNALIDALIKDIGDDIVSTGKALLDTKREIIPFAPNLNSILGGGIPEGTMVLIAGKPKNGKSSAILHFLKNAQQAGRHIWYFDVESRLKEMRLIPSRLSVDYLGEI